MKNKTNRKFKAILFDKDGVLIDSCETCLDALNMTLEHYGRPKIDVEFYVKNFWGVKLSENVEAIFGKTSEEELKGMIAYYRKKRSELNYKTKLFPNVVAVLQVLKTKYKLGVVTNSRTKVALKLLEDFEILNYFDVVVGPDNIQPKPAPDSILKACAHLEVSPQEALFIGDTLADIGAGKSANCTTAIITTSKPKEELEKIGEFIIINNLKEILEIV